MSRSADLCLYVLALQDGLFDEAGLDAHLRLAVSVRRSLKAILWEDGRVDRERLQRLLTARRAFERPCAGCGHVTYVMPSQEERCEACGAQDLRPARAEGYHDAERDRELRARAAAAAGLGHAPEEAAAPAARPQAPLPPPPAALAPGDPPSPWAALRARLLEAAAPLREDPNVALRLAAVFVVLPLLLFTLYAVLSVGAITWHMHEETSLAKARAKGLMRVVILTDPSRCAQFHARVLDSRRVRALADEYVWHMDNAARGEKLTVDRTDYYAGVPFKSSAMPHIWVFNQHGQVVTGLIGADDMTLDEFLALLEDARRDPRPLAERRAGGGS
ncbi:MAG: hypothetical protein M9894_18190 [Planctomycetes bacterium]|nr:hypothetical protein [Planctomycetota bacterium]